MPNTLSSNRLTTTLPADSEDGLMPINFDEIDNVLPAKAPIVAESPTTTAIQHEKFASVAPVMPPQHVAPAPALMTSSKPKAVPLIREKPPTLGRRLLNMLLVGLIYGFIGMVLDWVINLVKVVGSTHSSSMLWFFSYILLILGLVLGWLFGTRALNAIFGLFTNNASRFDDGDIFSAGLMRAVGIGLVFGIIGWLLMMMLV